MQERPSSQVSRRLWGTNGIAGGLSEGLVVGALYMPGWLAQETYYNTVWHDEDPQEECIVLEAV